MPCRSARILLHDRCRSIELPAPGIPVDVIVKDPSRLPSRFLLALFVAALVSLTACQPRAHRAAVTETERIAGSASDSPDQEKVASEDGSADGDGSDANDSDDDGSDAAGAPAFANRSLSLQERLASIAAGCASIPSGKCAEFLAAILDAREDPTLQVAALEALAGLAPESDAALAFERWPHLTPTVRRRLLDLFLHGHPKALVKWLRSDAVALADLPAEFLYHCRNVEDDSLRSDLSAALQELERRRPTAAAERATQLLESVVTSGSSLTIGGGTPR